ncbi:PilW family protein [Vibrio pelagius]|uniref:PilW family protein n=1 Tax=Vibrio pelagius TaxID=28169 RepID=UPI0021C3C812|nr:MSHA biogenesis protein MshO [Vibrio pelagius]
MVVSIILLGIVGLFSGEVIRQSLVLYSDVEARSLLIQQGRFATERLRRELREAVPNSVVTNLSGSCVEFFPIVNSGIYTNLPTTSPSNILRALPFIDAGDKGDRITVYPTSNFQLRDNIALNDNQVAILENDIDFSPSISSTMIDIEFTSSTTFGNNSPANRFYIYSQPVAFCIVGDELLRYEAYDMNRTLEPGDTTLGSGVALVDSLIDANFVAQEAQLQRNGLVKIELMLANNGEVIRFDDDALVYNTP